MFSLRNFEEGKGAPLGVLWLHGPADSVRVPGELQGMPAGDKVLWPKYVSAVPDCERSSFTRDCSDSKYVNWKIRRNGDRTHLLTEPLAHDAALESYRTVFGEGFSALCS